MKTKYTCSEHSTDHVWLGNLLESLQATEMRPAALSVVPMSTFAGSPVALWGCHAYARTFLGWSLALSPCYILHLHSSFDKEFETRELLSQNCSLTIFTNWAPPFRLVSLSSWQRFSQRSLYGSAMNFALESTPRFSPTGPCLKIIGNWEEKWWTFENMLTIQMWHPCQHRMQQKKR